MDLPLVSETIVSNAQSQILSYSVSGFNLCRCCGDVDRKCRPIPRRERALKNLEMLRLFVHFRTVWRIKPHLPPNEVNSDKQQGRPKQPGWGDWVVRETQSTEVIDDQRADQLPGDDGREEERGPQAADQEHGR